MINAPSNLPASSGDAPPYIDPLPFAEEEEAGGGFTIPQLWNMVRAHLWLSVGIFALMLGLAFLGIKKMPKSYYATAALIVNTDNTDPLAGRVQGIGQSYSFFPTQVELINNNVVLRPVADRLKLKADPFFNSGYVGDPKTLDDIVVAKLRSAVSVAQGAGSQLLYISGLAPSGQQAAEIANAVADEYMRQTKERINAPAAERAGRYTEQLAELKRKADDAQAKVAAFRERYGMTDFGQGTDLETAALADAETKLLQAQNARRQLEGQQGDSRAVGTIEQEAPEVTALHTKLDALQDELTKARATMGPRHPKVLQLQSEIDATRAAIQASAGKQLARAGELVGKFQTNVAAARQQLLDHRALQDQGNKLVLEQKLAEEAYAQALRGLDTVQFASQGNYQDVTMVSRAEPPLKSAKPNKLKLFAMAMAASLAVAFGGPFAYELLLRRRIRCRDDLERSFRIVMLAEFGRMNPAPTA
ncbi:MAG: hypothetical protein WDO12_04795 [Pseudomonadota bacterium]